MGFVRMALGKALAYSAVLGVDEALRPKWSAALAKMAPFRTTMVGGVEVFAQSASFTSDWNTTNETAGWPGSATVYTYARHPISMQKSRSPTTQTLLLHRGYPIIYDSGIHPADVITRSSDPALLQVARNTIWTDGADVKWNPVR